MGMPLGKDYNNQEQYCKMTPKISQVRISNLPFPVPSQPSGLLGAVW